MVNFKRIIIGALLIGIGIGVVLYLFPSEEKKVKKQFRLLSDWVSKDSGESPITMAYKIKNIGTLFDETCEFNIPAYSFSGTYSREEVSSYASSGRLSFTQLHLKFYDLNILFPTPEMAKVTFTAKVAGKLNRGESINEVHELESFLKKIDKKWLFSKFEVIEVLKK